MTTTPWTIIQSTRGGGGGKPAEQQPEEKKERKSGKPWDYELYQVYTSTLISKHIHCWRWPEFYALQMFISMQSETFVKQ